MAEITVHLEAIVSGLPKMHEVEFYGQIDEKTFFIVHHPYVIEEERRDEWDEKELGVQVGQLSNPEDLKLSIGERREIKLLPVRVKGVTRYTGERTLIINTAIGRFVFPDPCLRKEQMPNLDGRLINLF